MQEENDPGTLCPPQLVYRVKNVNFTILEKGVLELRLGAKIKPKKIECPLKKINLCHIFGYKFFLLLFPPLLTQVFRNKLCSEQSRHKRTDEEISFESWLRNKPQRLLKY